METPNPVKIPSFKVERIGINLLKEYPNNAKKHLKEQIDKIIKSIESFGFRQPILINNLNEKLIIAGHGRLYAAKELNMTEVPCIFAEDLTPEQIKLYRLMDNKSAESEWDFSLLGREFKGLEELKLDLDLTGFGFDEIAGIMKIVPIPPDNLVGEEKDKKPFITISFSSLDSLQEALPKIKEIISNYKGTYISCSANEL